MPDSLSKPEKLQLIILNGVNSLYLHKKLLLETLITMLAGEGIVISPAVAIDIEKILLNTDEGEIAKPSDLKYRLTPLICRNREEQNIVHELFDRLDCLVPIPDFSHGSNKGTLTEPEIEIGWTFRTFWKKFKHQSAPFLIAFFLMLIPVGYAIWLTLSGFRHYIYIDGTSNAVIVNDTLKLTALVDSNPQKRDMNVYWSFSDSTQDTGFVVKKIVQDTGRFTAKAYIKYSRDSIIAKTDTITVLCELPPSVQIVQKDTVENDAANKAVRSTIFQPKFTNGKPDEAGYSFAWYINGKLYSHERNLDYHANYITLKLVVGCRHVHCSADSLVSPVLESSPAVNIRVTGKAPKIQSPFTLDNILMNIAFLLFIPAFVAFPVYFFLSERQNSPAEVTITTAGTNKPYQIAFEDQTPGIHTEDGIRKLAGILRSRQTGDNFKLNIPKTIYETVRTGGIPSIKFSPQSKPQSFLILIDKQSPDNQITNLFFYLVDKLKKDEVDLNVYEYFKEPLFLSNEHLNHYRIPIEKLYALYPDTTLIIVGDAQYFIYPLKRLLKPWVTEKLSNWNTRILLTPYSVKDWDQKEKLLEITGLKILSADLSSIVKIEEFIGNGHEIGRALKTHADTTYRSRFLGFQDIHRLENYLNNPFLFQWICSLAVYPAIDWNFTIAIGKAIENDLKSKGSSADLVNYTNLLKISRISWMQDDVISESLRLDMLGRLGKSATLLARQTLYSQLEAISASIKDDSFVKSQFELHRTLNRFLVDVYQEKNTTIASDNAIKKIRESSELDEAQNIYFNRDEPIVPHPQKKDESVSLGKYFELKEKIAARRSFMPSLILFGSLLIASAVYLYWCNSTKTVVVNFSVAKTNSQAFKNFTVKISDDSTFATQLFTSDIHVGDTGKMKTFTARIRTSPMIDTNSFNYVKVLSASGALLAETKFKRNLTSYDVFINQIKKPAITVFFNGQQSQALAYAVSQALLSTFEVNTVQQSSVDTNLARIYYPSGQQQNASDVALIASNLLHKNIKPQPVPAKGTNILAIYINSGNVSRKIGITGVPAWFNEIWHGGTSNRLFTVNLSKRVLYYSIDNIQTYGTYTIDEVWLTKTGVYKFITKTVNQGYKLFFARVTASQTMELSVCQDFVANKADLYGKDESYCDKFNTMSNFYYYKDKPLIYLPVSGTSLSATEQNKLNSKIDSIKTTAAAAGIKSYNVTADIVVYSTNYLPLVAETGVAQLLGNNLSVNSYVNRTLSKSNPFQRNFLEIALKYQAISPPVIDSVSPAPKPVIDKVVPIVTVNQSSYAQPVTYTESWFKPNHYLQFDNIKVLLTDLDKGNQTATVQVCDMVGSSVCNYPIVTAVINVDKPYSFKYGKLTYTIKITAIKAAPLSLKTNPLTPAAYIIFSKNTQRDSIPKT